MAFNELLLKTAFCCMACDGEIASEEVEMVKKYAMQYESFGELNVEEKLNDYVEQINSVGKSFLNTYLDEVSSAGLGQDEELSVVKLAIEMIEADQNVEYSEISFFKEIRNRLKISDEAILEVFPDKEDYLLPDVRRSDYFGSINYSFNNISL